jgi:hypothetical protein
LDTAAEHAAATGAEILKPVRHDRELFAADSTAALRTRWIGQKEYTAALPPCYLFAAHRGHRQCYIILESSNSVRRRSCDSRSNI